MRTAIKTILALTYTLLLAACGAGGGGSSSGSADALTSSATSQAGLVDKIWAVPAFNSVYGYCAMAAKFSSSGQFGLIYICHKNGSSFVYEAAYGTYKTNGDQLVLDATPDFCSNYKTIFWDPSTVSNSKTLTFSLSGRSLTLGDQSGVIRLVEVTSSNESDFPFTAARGCYVEQSGSSSWVPFGNTAYTAKSISEELNSKTGSTAVVVPPAVIPGNGQGGCYDTRNLYNTGLTLGFTGQTSIGGTGIKSYMTLYGANSGIPGGYTNTYYRDTALGDRIDIAINGSSSYAQVTFAPATIAWINVRGGGQICGVYIDAHIHSMMYGKAQGGYDGNFGGGTVGAYTSAAGQFLTL